MPKRVLVVEDDLLVRLVICHHLQGMGWQVHEVDTGRAALEALANDARNVDAVLTDLQLPDMNGVELARQAEIECPFVFMSGTPGSPKNVPGPMLHKPFGEKDLRAVFAEILLAAH